MFEYAKSQDKKKTKSIIPKQKQSLDYQQNTPFDKHSGQHLTVQRMVVYDNRTDDLNLELVLPEMQSRLDPPVVGFNQIAATGGNSFKEKSKIGLLGHGIPGMMNAWEPNSTGDDIAGKLIENGLEKDSDVSVEVWACSSAVKFQSGDSSLAAYNDKSLVDKMKGTLVAGGYNKTSVKGVPGVHYYYSTDDEKKNKHFVPTTPESSTTALGEKLITKLREKHFFPASITSNYSSHIKDIRTMFESEIPPISAAQYEDYKKSKIAIMRDALQELYNNLGTDNPNNSILKPIEFEDWVEGVGL